ncbi:hypothetical protein N7495_006635 [Penicillium taxi]|uniref:uncharacterized protein n=1 Tax=Penicillium taxi TaxID=168475 RepID=UPI0025456683|nr:uncharacterized protein N7495_006635 [Penicillium taxi]KAJ5894944.1 hypothetical protein N7495_006635 [Penicillium taxi]
MSGSCEVCSLEPFKYRCPTCEVKSCSLACTQAHKIYCTPKPVLPIESQPPSDTSQLQFQNGESHQATASSAPNTKQDKSPAGGIDKYTELKELLDRFPQLRSQLREIYEATQEEKWVEWYRPPMRGRPSARGRSQGKKSRGPWTAEKGFKRGLGKVRKFRQDCDDEEETGTPAEAFMRFYDLAIEGMLPK